MVSHTRFGAKAPRLQRRRYEKTQTEMLAKKGAGETRGQERREEREEGRGKRTNEKKRRKEREAGKKREAEAGKQKGSKRHNKINLTKLEQDEKTL